MYASGSLTETSASSLSRVKLSGASLQFNALALWSRTSEFAAILLLLKEASSVAEGGCSWIGALEVFVAPDSNSTASFSMFDSKLNSNC